MLACVNRLKLVFTDGREVSITVEDDAAAATVTQQIVRREGEYASGWLQDPHDDRTLWNLGALVRIELYGKAGDQPLIAWI